MKNSYSNIFSFNKKILKKSVKNLNNSNIVGLPTETVYGLGGNAYSKKSIQKMNDSLEKSIESLNIFGNHAKNLVLLADYIVKRSH